MTPGPGDLLRAEIGMLEEMLNNLGEARVIQRMGLQERVNRLRAELTAKSYRITADGGKVARPATAVDAIEADGSLINPRKEPCMVCDGSGDLPENEDS